MSPEESSVSIFDRGEKEEAKPEEEMPRSLFSGAISAPKVDVIIEVGNPFLNQPLDGFLKIGTLKKMCNEGACWGTIGGVYIGMEHGIERIRGTRDWKNALIGGAITGAPVSAACNDSRDTVVVDAITGGAIATAANVLNHLTT